MRLAVFDCDGTLVDGQAAICESMETAFLAAGLEKPDRQDVRRIVGLSLPAALTRLAPYADEETRADIVAEYKAAFFDARSSGRSSEPLYDGMESLLRALHAEGWRLAVATGKSDRGLHACLTTHGIADLFTSLQTADRHPSKPHPAMLEAALFECGAAPVEAVMIGDTSFDMTMAKHAGVRAIGVTWGYHETEELREAGADGIAETMQELHEVLNG